MEYGTIKPKELGNIKMEGQHQVSHNGLFVESNLTKNSGCSIGLD